jgi:hypothetical protein
MKSKKREGSFLGQEDLEEGKGHWKDTLWEGEEEFLGVFLRIEDRGLGRERPASLGRLGRQSVGWEVG